MKIELGDEIFPTKTAAKARFSAMLARIRHQPHLGRECRGRSASLGDGAGDERANARRLAPKST